MFDMNLHRNSSGDWYPDIIYIERCRCWYRVYRYIPILQYDQSEPEPTANALNSHELDICLCQTADATMTAQVHVEWHTAMCWKSKYKTWKFNHLLPSNGIIFKLYILLPWIYIPDNPYYYIIVGIYTSILLWIQMYT